MGLPLHLYPNGSAGDAMLDDAQLVYEPKHFPLCPFPNGLVGGPLLVPGADDLSLYQCPNGSVSDTLLEDSVPGHDGLSLHQRPSGFVCASEPRLDDKQLVHSANGSPEHQRPSGSVSDPQLDDTHLVLEPKPRDPHVVPTFTNESITKPRSIVLYLPPLLSSLPQDLSVPPVSIDRPPLVTESRLPNIDPVSLSLHKALHHFGPVSRDYAALHYADAFNWLDLELPEDEEREWYAVAFRSLRKKGSDSSPLYDADRRAHEEAVSNGGLLMYWYGVPNQATGMNLATCIWQSRRHAVAANSRPHHIQAMRLAAASYEVYRLERYRLSKVKGEKGILVEEFSGEECGW